jgi:uncharacterized repeat protein (TIGR03803 family)
MRYPKSFLRLTISLALCAGTLFALTPRAGAQQESVLHSFNPSSRDGLNPQANLILDIAGNLYGTTFDGGIHGCNGGTFNCGTVFEMSPLSGGGWTEKILHNFGKGTDGSNPTAGLVFDAAGNLYGTTVDGGAYALGTVFELSPGSYGGWTEKVLHHFSSNGTDGIRPYAGVIIDGSGNLYGTTSGGGTTGAGIVFELTPHANGSWTEKILHSFSYPNPRTEGWNPMSSLAADASGNLYGVTVGGGFYGYGVAFELSPAAEGGWTEKILHAFNSDGKDGWQPYNGVSIDGRGNLYGTTPFGGAYENGALFELTLSAGGTWAEKIIHSFNADGTDGVRPLGGVTLDAAGNVYGTTYAGGPSGGIVFEFSPAAGGSWTETILHDFDNNGIDGTEPMAGLVFDSAGNLYGTTSYGGSFYNEKYGYVYGTVFEITP